MLPTGHDSRPDLNAFIPPSLGASRSPCPALNALANHGYIPRQGTDIPFWTLFTAVKSVYNLTFPFALLLTTVGYLTCGRFILSTRRAEKEPTRTRGGAFLLEIITFFVPWLSWTLDLSSLCTHGPLKIAHDASLVHSDGLTPVACAPNPVLLSELLALAHHQSLLPATELPGVADSATSKKIDGLTLADLGHIHAAHEARLLPRHALDLLHEQVALGECGLAWCVMRSRGTPPALGESGGVIPVAVIEQWFGQERLPLGWWDLGGGRPTEEVGLREAGKRAKEVGLWHHR